MNAQEKKQFQEMNTKVTVIEERQQAHAEIQKEMHDKIEKVYVHIVGDPQLKVKGVIEKVNGFDLRLTRWERGIVLVTGLFTSTMMYLTFVKDVFNFWTK